MLVALTAPDDFPPCRRRVCRTERRIRTDAARGTVNEPNPDVDPQL